MHNVGEMEYQNIWGRFWVDFGGSENLIHIQQLKGSTSLKTIFILTNSFLGL